MAAICLENFYGEENRLFGDPRYRGYLAMLMNNLSNKLYGRFSICKSLSWTSVGPTHVSLGAGAHKQGATQPLRSTMKSL